MRKLLVAWCLLALWPAAVCAKEIAAAAPARQILVMLRIQPSHYRPTGDYGGGYGDQISQSVRERIAAQVAKLNPDSEREALLWIEAVSEFDGDEPR